MNRIFLLFSLISMVSFMAKTSEFSQPKNIIFVIVDGMGPEQVKASRIFRGGKPHVFEEFAYKSEVSTHNISREVTDSAAAATAIATGAKVANEVLSLQIPGNDKPLKTILEAAKTNGKSTGLVTTMLITDATPAGFASHTKNRHDTDNILRDYFDMVQPNVIFGADLPNFKSKASASAARYRMISNAYDLAQLDKAQMVSELKCTPNGCPHVYGGFGQHALIANKLSTKAGMPLEITGTKYFTKEKIPHLADMTRSALKVLEQNDKGFFLMVESALVDWIGHMNAALDKTQGLSAIEVQVHEMTEVDRTMRVITEWMKKHPDTLLVMTADHETGGLVVKENETKCLGKKGCIPTVAWTSADYPDHAEKVAQHTGVKVPVYATGKNAYLFAKPMDNTEFVAKSIGTSLNQTTKPSAL